MAENKNKQLLESICHVRAVSKFTLILGPTGSGRGRAVPRQQRTREGVGCTAKGREKGGLTWQKNLQPQGGETAEKQQGAPSRSHRAMGQR